MQPGDDPDAFRGDQNEENEGDAQTAQGDDNKIGGTPFFLQFEEYPPGGSTWKLLLQLDSVGVPFDINFGDAGIGYGFVSEDGRIGKFLWQCL